MPLYTADALILRTYKLGEADRIVVFLTRDRGKKRGVAKGARRPRSRFVGALEPMTEVRVAYFEKESRELVGLNYAETVRSPMAYVGRTSVRPANAQALGPAEAGPHDGGGAPPVGSGFSRTGDGSSRTEAVGRDTPVGSGFSRTGDSSSRTDAVGRDTPVGSGFSRTGDSLSQTCDALEYVGYFAELLDEWAQDADADERLFRLGASMLDAFAVGAPAEALARYFECWLLRLQGVYPESRGSLSEGALAFLAASRSVPPHCVGDVVVERRVLRELEAVHRALITMHLEKTLKSDRVLRDLRRHA